MWFRRQHADPSWERIVAAHQQPGEVSRACSDIVKTILLEGGSADRKAILISSAGESEGKTTMALHLAAMLATRRRTVLLLDIHGRRPALSRILGLADRPGFAEALEAGGRYEEFVVPNEKLPSLSVLPSGVSEVDLVQPGLEDRVRSVLGRAKAAHDFVLLDGGPVSSGPETLVFSGLADGVVLVVACDKTQQSEVVAARHTLSLRGATLIGAVVNRVPGYLPDYYRKH